VTTPAVPQERLETAQEANDRITQLMLASSGKRGDYVLASGDLLGIEVFDVAELTRDVRVSELGFISLPLLPVRIRASGLTAFQLQDKLAELLQANDLVTNPQVTVSVKEQHGEPITVIGAVKTPMVIQAVRQMTLLEVLSRAGGIADDAGGQILITRPAPVVSPESAAGDAPVETAAEANAESMTVKIGLHDLLDTGDSQYNIALQGGDVVSVPRAGVVYAVGAVQRPGGFVMQNDRQQLTVIKILSLSGGWTTTAKPRNAVIIRQSAEGDRRQVPVDLEKILASKAEDPALQQSDILFVPNSGSRQAMGRVAQAAISLATGVAIVRLGN
jgi:polysaccharide export outer membrane protein